MLSFLANPAPTICRESIPTPLRGFAYAQVILSSRIKLNVIEGVVAGVVALGADQRIVGVLEAGCQAKPPAASRRDRVSGEKAAKVNDV